MSVNRRLAAILAADVVSYSRLMGADEEGTLARLKAVRAEVIDPALHMHQGRVVKTTGDGILAEFASSVEAVRCAVAVQEAMAARNAGEDPGRRIELRVGINVGDVIVEGDDLYGDGVNIAARMETLSPPGGVCISGAVHEQVRDKLAIDFRDLGDQQVKNIVRPVHVYAFAPAGVAIAARTSSARGRAAVIAGGVAGVAALAVAGWLAWSAGTTAPAPLAVNRSAIVVLPFANMSGDPQQDFLGDGFTEDLTTALARVTGITVTARNTAFTYKGKAVNVPVLGRELGVGYVLEGSVQRSGEKLRLNAQLIDTATGNHVWAERIERPMADLFVVQDELTEKVAGSVASQVRRREGERAAAAPPETLAAYELTMRARLLRRSGDRDAVIEARRLALQAIERNPGYAMAHVQLAIALNSLFANRWTEDFAAAATAQRMLEATTRAVSLAPGDPLARSANAVALTNARDFDAAMEDGQRALALDADDTDVLSNVAIVLDRAGQHERAVELVRKAMALDPYLAPTTVGSVLANALYHLGRPEEAIELSRVSAQRAATNYLVRVSLLAAYGQTGRTSSAPGVRAELDAVMPGFTLTEFRRGAVYLRNGADVDRLVEGLRKAGVPE